VPATQESPLVRPTATPGAQVPATPATGGPTGLAPGTYEDDFSRDNSNFEIFAGSEIYGGKLHLGPFNECADLDANEERPFGCFTVCLACGFLLDYSMQVDVQYEEGVSDRTYGLVLRFVDFNGNSVVDRGDYMMTAEISAFDAWYTVWEHLVDGGWQQYDRGYPGNILTGYKVNTIRADSYGGGQYIDIYMNGKFIQTVEFTEGFGGLVGLTAGGRRVKVAFDNFRITVP
jgi:hypothetical protein